MVWPAPCKAPEQSAQEGPSLRGQDVLVWETGSRSVQLAIKGIIREGGGPALELEGGEDLAQEG